MVANTTDSGKMASSTAQVSTIQARATLRKASGARASASNG
jgi:hypothetical protein